MEKLAALWARALEKAKAAWRWLTAKVDAVPLSNKAVVQVAAILAAVSLWIFFKAVPGAVAPALAMTMVVADLALIVALLAYCGVDAIFNAARQAGEAAV